MRKIGIGLLISLLLLTSCARHDPEAGTAGTDQPSAGTGTVENFLYSTTVLAGDWLCFEQTVRDGPGSGVYVAQLGVDKTPRLLAEDGRILLNNGPDLFVQQGNDVFWYDMSAGGETWTKAGLAEDVQDFYYCGVRQEQVYLMGEQEEGSRFYVWSYKTKSGLTELPGIPKDAWSNWTIEGDTAYTWRWKQESESEVLQLDLTAQTAKSLGTVPNSNITGFALADGTLFCSTPEELYVYDGAWEKLTEFERTFSQSGCRFYNGKAYTDGAVTAVWSLADRALEETIEPRVFCNEYGVLSEDAGVFRLTSADGKEYTFDAKQKGWNYSNLRFVFSDKGLAVQEPGYILAAAWDGGATLQYEP